MRFNKYFSRALSGALGLTVLVVFLGMRMDHKLLAVILILVVAALAALSYRIVMRLSKKGM